MGPDSERIAFRRRLGMTLARLREMAGMTQEGVAAEMGVDADSISRWEKGRNELRAFDLARLAKLYGAPAVRRLFGRNWNGWYVPYHVTHWTRPSLAAAVAEAGLRLDRVDAADLPMMGRSIQMRRRSGYGPGLLVLGALLQPAQLAIGAVTRTSVNLRARAVRD